MQGVGGHQTRIPRRTLTVTWDQYGNVPQESEQYCEWNSNKQLDNLDPGNCQRDVGIGHGGVCFRTDAA